jgi:hypothetical protein
MQDAMLVIVKDDYTVKFSNEKAKRMFGIEDFEIAG